MLARASGLSPLSPPHTALVLRATLSTIDKERIAAVAKLQALGYRFSLAGGWTPPNDGSSAGTDSCTAEADAMHAALMRRADALQRCTEGSQEETELEGIVDAIEAYEVKRWPESREPGRKG